MGASQQEKATSHKTRSVAIVLGDNDFGTTFKNLLDTVVNTLIYDPDTPAIAIETFIRSAVRSHYLGFQYKWEYHGGVAPPETELQRLESYLLNGHGNSRPLRIIFDDAADLAYASEDHDHGAWHLHVASGQINSF